MKTKAKHPRNLITFQGHTESLAVALAKGGMGDSVIMEDTNYTPGQIAYRLRKAQKLEGTTGGYRRAWSKCQSEEARMFKKDFIAIFQHEVQRTLPPLIAHPAPVFVNVKEQPAPTIDETVRQLKRQKAGFKT